MSKKAPIMVYPSGKSRKLFHRSNSSLTSIQSQATRPANGFSIFTPESCTRSSVTTIRARPFILVHLTFISFISNPEQHDNYRNQRQHCHNAVAHGSENATSDSCADGKIACTQEDE